MSSLFGFFILLYVDLCMPRHLGPGFSPSSILSIKCACTTYRIKNQEFNFFSNFGPTRGIQRSTYKRMKKRAEKIYVKTSFNIPLNIFVLCGWNKKKKIILNDRVFYFLSTTIVILIVIALGSRIFSFFNFINKMCMYNV
jgi:hypothetical protein